MENVGSRARVSVVAAHGFRAVDLPRAGIEPSSSDAGGVFNHWTTGEVLKRKLIAWLHQVLVDYDAGSFVSAERSFSLGSINSSLIKD